MGSLLTLLLPALVPVLADGARGLFSRFTGAAGALPQNVGEQIQLMQAQTARVEALARLDAAAGPIAPWVANLRASFRYFAVGGIVLSTLAGVFMGLDAALLALLLDLTGATMSFIIGERMYLHLKK
jgi:hypothetical protein